VTTISSSIVQLDNTFARELPELGVEFQPAAVPTPELIALNIDFATELGIDPAVLESPEGVALLAGNATPPGATPIAMAYAGHQFGGFSPRLGDGRAVLLGELPVGDHLCDVHLKGSGRTPFARGGDGKAALGPMLREFLMAEAMHALGISTARALAVVTTGEQIQRDRFEPGAVLTRVAASHIRVGTFEYAVRLADRSVLQRLAAHAIARHYPAAAESAENRYLVFFESVVDAQAALIADWMLVGFIHGVMNTDNVAISGETIDYGPCAFMDRYAPATVYSSIDRSGRYAYGNQPAIAQWNLARLAETLLPLIDADLEMAATAVADVLAAFPDRYQEYWLAGMRRKLGLVDAASGDGELVDGLFGLLGAHRVDYTTTFRALANTLRTDENGLRDLFGTPASVDAWTATWRSRIETEGRDLDLVAGEMDRTNPIYVPRNHTVDEAVAAATAGDTAQFHTLLDIVTSPYDGQPGLDRYARPAPDSFDETFQTFCGT
jgi:uncharacterized protein YdiU (UPF0061 family)